jgi:hypothetical protein
MTIIIGKELSFANTVHRYVFYVFQTKYHLGYFPQQHLPFALYTGKTGIFCEVGTDSLIKIWINFMFDITGNPTRNS